MLLMTVIVLGTLWLLGLLAHVGGAFINIVLLVALVVLIYDFATRSRSQFNSN